MLEKNATELEANIPEPITGDSFGQSSWGSQLGFDAGLAQQVVIKEVPEMVAGLRGYTDNLRLFVDDATETDVREADTINKFTAATECVGTPSFSDPGQCQVPTDTEGEDS
ncbi:MAG: hypothetical protein H0X12_00715 [Nocardioides sp.]|nr:hypothetical protein [Nocardioides sp.]